MTAMTATRTTTEGAAGRIWLVADRPWSTVAYVRIQIRDSLMRVVDLVRDGCLDLARAELKSLGDRYSDASSAIEQITEIIDRAQA